MAPHAAPRTSFCRGWGSEIAPPLLCYSFFVVHSSSSDEAPRGCHPERAHVVRERGTCFFRECVGPAFCASAGPAVFVTPGKQKPEPARLRTGSGRRQGALLSLPEQLAQLLATAHQRLGTHLPAGAVR